jgi:CubicO group peptidase (beta-lactamase class C family)
MQTSRVSGAAGQASSATATPALSASPAAHRSQVTREAPSAIAADHEPAATLADRADEFTARLATVLEQWDVPGAAFGVARDDEIVTGAAGLLHRGTGYPVTADSWFQVGSITKVFTVTLVMQLVDDGLIDLDTPVVTYLEGFDVGSETANATITVRHLLSHTSGIDGDYFADFGRGLDACARYVASLPEVGMLYEPDALFSYCNSGFSVLGLLLERLRGKDYDTILTERLLTPLGIAGGTLAEQAILHRSAVGHVPGADDGPAVPESRWALPYASSSVGSTLFTDPAGLIAFAHMHLAGGVAPDGTRILSEASVAEMQRPYRSLPAIGQTVAVGASWFVYGWDGETVIGHTGGTRGQFSYLFVHPDSRSIVVALTNGPGAGQVFAEFVVPLLAELAGITPPEFPTPPQDPPPMDTERLRGSYAHYELEIDVEPSEGGVTVTLRPEENEALGETGESQSLEFVPHSVTADDLFLVTGEPIRGLHGSIVFPAGTGPAPYLQFGSRVSTRVTC